MRSQSRTTVLPQWVRATSPGPVLPLQHQLLIPSSLLWCLTNVVRDLPLPLLPGASPKRMSFSRLPSSLLIIWPKYCSMRLSHRTLSLIASSSSLMIDTFVCLVIQGIRSILHQTHISKAYRISLFLVPLEMFLLHMILHSLVIAAFPGAVWRLISADESPLDFIEAPKYTKVWNFLYSPTAAELEVFLPDLLAWLFGEEYQRSDEQRKDQTSQLQKN